MGWDGRHNKLLWLLQKKAGGPQQLVRRIFEINQFPPPKQGQRRGGDLDILSIDTEPDGYQIMTFKMGHKIYLAIVRPKRVNSRPGLYKTAYETLRESAAAALKEQEASPPDPKEFARQVEAISRRLMDYRRTALRRMSRKKR
jgi:hypothetical protein